VTGARKALLLDALGTLVRLEPPALPLRETLRERFGVEVSEAQAAHAIAQEIGFYRQHLDLGSDEPGLATLRARCAEVLRAALPPSPKLESLETLELQAALLSALRFSPFEDVVPALSELRRRGASLVVVSNWDISLHDVLGRLRLAPLLDGILTSAEVGARKPAAAIFRRGLELAGAAAAEVSHVGDSLAEDVTGARNAGIEPILIARAGERGPEDVRMIRTLRELLT
jgi:putative hydrolase of the HAD superfamily